MIANFYMLADTIAASPFFYLQPCLMLFSIGKCFPQARKFRATDTFLLFPSDTFLLLPSDTFFPTWHFLAHPDILKDILYLSNFLIKLDLMKYGWIMDVEPDMEVVF